MKYLSILFLLTTLSFINYHCQGQKENIPKYSKIDFGLDTFSTFPIGLCRDRYWIGRDPFLKRNDYLNRYYFPKNSKQWEKYADTVECKRFRDSAIKLLLNKDLLLKYFDVYAFWVDGKYVSKMKEGAEDGTMVDFYYLEDDVVIPYTLYKLIDKGWLWLEDGKKKVEINFEDRLFISYLKPETIPVNFPKEWLQGIDKKN